MTIIAIRAKNGLFVISLRNKRQSYSASLCVRILLSLNKYSYTYIVDIIVGCTHAYIHLILILIFDESPASGDLKSSSSSSFIYTN